MPDLETLGFHLVGYGCTTCIGNSGPAARAGRGGGQGGRPGRRGGALRATATSRAASTRSCAPTTWPRRRWWSPTRSPGRWTSIPQTEPLGTDRHGQAGLPARHLADARRRSARRSPRCRRELFREEYARRLRGRRALARAAGAGGRALRLGRRLDLRQGAAVLRRHAAASRRRRRTSAARACWRVLGDSVTTDHISPAGSIPTDSPAGTLPDRASASTPKDFNSYGARRGNHEVMMRGHVRQHPPAEPAGARASRAACTVHLPDGERMTIYDAADALPGGGRAAAS